MKGCSVLSIEDELQEYMFSGTANQQAVKKEEKKEHKALYPLSKTQLGVYIDCMKNPYSTLYNIPSILTFSKSVDAQKLADCVVKVIKAHPYIMTHLSLENDDISRHMLTLQNRMFPLKILRKNSLKTTKRICKAAQSYESTAVQNLGCRNRKGGISAFGFPPPYL